MPTKLIWIHAPRCGGDIDFKTRSCMKCKKRWSWISFYFLDTRSLRTTKIFVPYEPGKEKKATYASWADKVPYVGFLASKLPNWPRWARIVATLCFVLVLGGLAVYFIRGC